MRYQHLQACCQQLLLDQLVQLQALLVSFIQLLLLKLQVLLGFMLPGLLRACYLQLLMLQLLLACYLQLPMLRVLQVCCHQLNFMQHWHLLV